MDLSRAIEVKLSFLHINSFEVSIDSRLKILDFILKVYLEKLSSMVAKPNLRIIGYECPNILWCWIYLFREYGEENAICVETYIKQSSLSRERKRSGI